jgi:hypothetical protein
MIRRSIALASTAALVVALAVVSPALAGKGKPGGAAGATGPTMTFSSSTVVLGQQYRVNGSGFRPNTWVTVGAHFPDTIWWNSQQTDSQGRFSLLFTATSAGQIYHEAKERGTSGRLRLRATATLTVTS